MNRSRVFLPLLLIGFSPFYQPAFRLAAQCCGSGGGGANAKFIGSREKFLPGTAVPASASCGTSPMQVSVNYSGTDEGKLLVGDQEITLPAGGGKVDVSLPPDAMVAPGQTVDIRMTTAEGDPATSDQEAEVSWTFPKREKKEDCKKEEENEGTAICESCGNQSKLKGGDKDSLKAKCGDPKNSTQNPEGAPEDPQGSGSPCGDSGNLYDTKSGGGLARDQGVRAPRGSSGVSWGGVPYRLVRGGAQPLRQSRPAGQLHPGGS